MLKSPINPSSREKAAGLLALFVHTSIGSQCSYDRYQVEYLANYLTKLLWATVRNPEPFFTSLEQILNGFAKDNELLTFPFYVGDKVYKQWNCKLVQSTRKAMSPKSRRVRR